MKRRLFVGGTFAGLCMSSKRVTAQGVKAGDIPVTTLGKTGLKVSVIAQGGARMDLYLFPQSRCEAAMSLGKDKANISSLLAVHNISARKRLMRDDNDD